MASATPSSYAGSAFTVPTPPSDASATGTEHTTNTAVKNGLVTREFLVKFDFTATNNTAVPVYLHHRQVMHSILKAHGKQVTLFDSHDLPIELPRIATLTSALAHKGVFTIHTKVGTKVRPTRHTIIQKIRTSISIYDIKNTDSIAHHLKTLHIYIREHNFPIDVYDVVSLGWLRFLHPDHMTHECIRADIITAIQTTSGAKTVVPFFHLTNVSPMFKDEQDADMKTRAIQIMVNRNEQRDLDKLLRKAFELNPLYVPWRLKHQDPTHYRQNLRAQHKYLFQTYTVPISGINRMEMFYLREKIMETGLASSVQPTRTTDTIGRWNVLVKRDDFKEATRKFKDIINDYDEIVPNDKERAKWAYPRMVGKSVNETYGDEESEGAKSYASASIASLASIITLEDLEVPVMTPRTTFDLTVLQGKTYSEAVTNSIPAVPQAQDNGATTREATMQAKIDSLEARVIALIAVLEKKGSSTTANEIVPTDVAPDANDSLPPTESLTQDTSAYDELKNRQQAYEKRMTAQADAQAKLLAENSASLQQILQALKIRVPTGAEVTTTGKHEAPDANSLDERSPKMLDLKDTPIKSHPMPDAALSQNP